MLQLTSLDITNIVNELQQLVGKRITKIYQLDSSFTFKCSNSLNLNIVLPGLIFLSDKLKYATPQATNFAMSLRKHIANAKVMRVGQVACERIIKLTLHKLDKFQLIIELFSKGNLLLVDSNGIIKTLYSTQKWQSRELKRGLPYTEPPFNLGFMLTFGEFKQLVNDNKKEKIAKLLAVQLGLGGIYAEEICRRAGYEQGLKAAAVDAKKLYTELKSFINQPTNPTLYIKTEQPFFLSSYQLVTLSQFEQKGFNSLSSMIEFCLLKYKVKQHNGESEKLKRVLNLQKQHIKELESSVEEDRRKGELIYENYELLSSLISKAKDIAMKQGWKAAYTWLERQPGVVKVNKKQKSFTVEL